MTAVTLPPLTLDTIDAHLPPAPQPVGSYVASTRVGNLIYTSGTLPLDSGKVAYTGQIGSFTTTLEEGQAAARLAVLNALSVVKADVGDLKKVVRVVRLTGFVSCIPTFTQHPAVINAASDLLVEVFGDGGRHVRSAVGVTSLPLDAAVELELIVEVA